FRLPSKEELPERAVRRAHGKGAVEEGIYNHPVVVISKPVEESHLVHFHLITSLQGKKLDQLYNKSNEFHASRRSWYLPISPTPDHPDAISKKTKKRFPTLDLASGATLRWDSYVNIRHVYKIDSSLLKAYANPESPYTQLYRFERESTIRLLAKSKILTMYEPGSQHQAPGLKRSASEPIRVSTAIVQTVEDGSQQTRSPSSDRASVVSIVCSVASSPPESDFWGPNTEDYRIADRPPKVPPDVRTQSNVNIKGQETMWRPMNKMLKRVAAGFEGSPPARSFDPNTLRHPINRLWVDVKGVMAVAIASL
ncbi:hypothetical protein BKA66DRAFT_405510, partial [Pyrenochaeta sp. MPI-SDFR-AT-0127]